MTMLSATTIAAIALASRPRAQELALASIAGARLRYEHVEQADLPRDAEALTLRRYAHHDADGFASKTDEHLLQQTGASE